VLFSFHFVLFFSTFVFLYFLIFVFFLSLELKIEENFTIQEKVVLGGEFSSAVKCLALGFDPQHHRSKQTNKKQKINLLTCT
jgi:hypothetical protein